MVEKNLPKLPKEWAWAKLEHCVEILDSKRIPVNANEREERISGKKPAELIPYYGATGKVGWIDDYLFDEELILLGEDGAPFFDSFKNKAYIVRGKSWVNNHAHVLRAIYGLTTNLFISHYLNLFDYHGYVSGTTRLKLNQGPMRNIPVPLPPIDEQHRIVAKMEELFSDLDAGVEALKKAKAQLKLYRRAVLKAAFEGRLTAAWRGSQKSELEQTFVLLEKIRVERKKASQASHKEFLPVDASTLHRLPEEWQWVSLGELVSSMQNGIYKPREFYSSDGMACLRMYNIENGEIIWKDIKRMTLSEEEITKYELKVNDILINRVNSRELVGKAAVIPANLERCVYESKNIRMRLINKFVESKYINYWLRLFGQGYFDMNAQQVVGMASINQQQISAMPVPFTHPFEQHQIIQEAEFRFSISDEMEKGIDKDISQAERLRQSILKKAFAGGLVPQDPEDEPAAELLERIKADKAGQAAGSRSRRTLKRPAKLW